MTEEDAPSHGLLTNRRGGSILIFEDSVLGREECRLLHHSCNFLLGCDNPTLDTDMFMFVLSECVRSDLRDMCYSKPECVL